MTRGANRVATNRESLRRPRRMARSKPSWSRSSWRLDSSMSTRSCGIVGHEGIHQRHDETFAVGYGAGHAQQALGSAERSLTARRASSRASCRRWQCCRKVCPLRSATLAGCCGRAGGSAGALQAGDLAADVRRGNAHAFGCRGELPGFGDSDEFVESFPAIHLDCPCMAIMF